MFDKICLVPFLALSNYNKYMFKGNFTFVLFIFLNYTLIMII